MNKGSRVRQSNKKDNAVEDIEKTWQTFVSTAGARMQTGDGGGDMEGEPSLSKATRKIRNELRTPQLQKSGAKGGMSPRQVGVGSAVRYEDAGSIDTPLQSKEERNRRRRSNMREVDSTKLQDLETKADYLLQENESLKEKLRMRQESYLRRESRYEQKIEALKAQLEQAIVSRSVFDDKMSNLKSLNDQIQEGIENMQGKTEKIVKSREDTLSKSFKAKIDEMEKELQEEKKQHMIGADEWIQKTKRYSKELEWTREEALKLDALNKKLQEDNRALQVQFQAQQDDRQFMAKQIAQMKKENSALRKQIESLEEQVSTLTTAGPPRALHPREEELEVGNRNEDVIDEGDFAGLSALERQQKYVETIKRLRRLLDMERRNVKAARASQIALLAERTELEVFLRQCIEDVRQEIVQRQTELSRAARKPGRSAGDPSSGYEEFTVVDRQHVLELLLSKERVLTLLCEKTFPSGRDMDNAALMDSPMVATGPAAGDEGLYEQWKEWAATNSDDEKPGNLNEAAPVLNDDYLRELSARDG